MVILCIFLHITFHYIIQCLILLFILFSSCRFIRQLMADIFVVWIFWGLYKHLFEIPMYQFTYFKYSIPHSHSDLSNCCLLASYSSVCLVNFLKVIQTWQFEFQYINLLLQLTFVGFNCVVFIWLHWSSKFSSGDTNLGSLVFQYINLLFPFIYY